MAWVLWRQIIPRPCREGGNAESCRTDKDDKLTSPFASRVFILSKKLDSKMLDSSRMKTIFSFLQPARLSTARKSSSKSAAKYLRWIYKNKFEIISFQLWQHCLIFSTVWCVNLKSRVASYSVSLCFVLFFCLFVSFLGLHNDIRYLRYCNPFSPFLNCPSCALLIRTGSNMESRLW